METVLGVKVDNLEKKEILEKIESFLIDGQTHQIATINPEFILEAQKDEEFKNILNGCDLNIADGIGIWFAFLRFGKLLKSRIAGADLMNEILKIVDEKKLSVFLAVNKNGLSSYEEVYGALFKRYPNIKFDGADIDPQCHSDPPVGGEESQEIINNNIVTGSFAFAQDDKKNIDILFVNFGAPYQEKFINSLKNDIIGVAMGVGGSFDYETRKAKRAPKIMRQLGLEWLWRLILQPQRWKRIWNAVVIFPFKVIFNK